VPKQIGIDLGTANVLVFLRGRGIVINEPSVVAISTSSAVGLEARNMLGREPRETIEVVRPMRDGVIADYVVTQEMLRYFINKSCGRFSLVRPEVMICVPAGVTGVERRAVRDAALAAGARKAFLISEPLAAAIGARVPVADPSGNMIIDIGGGTTEVAVISLNGIVVARSLRVGGNRFDEAIANYIKRKYNLRVGERTAEEVKIAIGSAMPVEEDIRMEVRGRDEVAGLPRTIQIVGHYRQRDDSYRRRRHAAASARPDDGGHRGALLRRRRPPLLCGGRHRSGSRAHGHPARQPRGAIGSLENP
jgi:rod shape-determining protein MreB